MRLSHYKFLVGSDLYRHCARKSIAAFLSHVLLRPGFKYAFWMRTARYFKAKGAAGWPFYVISRSILNHYQFKYGISIPYNTEIGPGFYIGHFGGIVINHEVVIGANCNISQGVTLGAKYGGKFPGNPRIGNNVYIGPHAVVIGGITIGDHVAIGANCVVAQPVANAGVVVGSAGEVISYNGSSGYVVNTVC